MSRDGARPLPAPLELECLKALWKLGGGNVKDVRLALAGNRDLAYTTVMTVLERLTRKGGVVRRKVGRSFLYSPALSRDHLRRLAVEGLVDSFFDGSESELIAYLRAGGAGANAASESAHPAAIDPALDTALL